MADTDEASVAFGREAEQAKQDGDLDIVPKVAGEYTVLAGRARMITSMAGNFRAVHPDDLLSTLTIPRRAKDLERVREHRKIHRKVTAE